PLPLLVGEACGNVSEGPRRLEVARLPGACARNSRDGGASPVHGTAITVWRLRKKRRKPRLGPFLRFLRIFRAFAGPFFRFLRVFRDRVQDQRMTSRGGFRLFGGEFAPHQEVAGPSQCGGGPVGATEGVLLLASEPAGVDRAQLVEEPVGVVV